MSCEANSLPLSLATQERIPARPPREGHASDASEGPATFDHQLAVCAPRRAVRRCEVWMDVNELAEVYIAVSVDAHALPTRYIPTALNLILLYLQPRS